MIRVERWPFTLKTLIAARNKTLNDPLSRGNDRNGDRDQGERWPFTQKTLTAVRNKSLNEPLSLNIVMTVTVIRGESGLSD